MSEIATEPASTAVVPSASEVIVQTERLTKRFGARTAVNALDLGGAPRRSTDLMAPLRFSTR